MATEIQAADGLTRPPAWALACVPGLDAGHTPRVLRRLEGGSVNDVWRVDSEIGRFVLRLDGAAWRRPGVERERELVLHRAAAQAGIAPAIVHAEPARGLLIMQYLSGRIWDETDFDNVRALVALGERLRILHSLPVPDVGVFEPWRVAQAYLERVESGVVASASLRRLQVACEELRYDAPGSSIVHGDLWQGNVLQGSRLWLLDWEYAQRSDPLMDIACVLAYYPAAQRHRVELVAAAGFDHARVGAALEARVTIYRGLSWLWHLARGEQAAAP